ncbi:unnamed protein product [Closterium sp. Yama58-4]|nr:unnamed protein product [Closterium sp. Yama58-4]
MADSWLRVSREYRAAGILPYSFDSDGRLLFLFQAEASKKKPHGRNGVRRNTRRGIGAEGEDTTTAANGADGADDADDADGAGDADGADDGDGGDGAVGGGDGGAEEDRARTGDEEADRLMCADARCAQESSCAGARCAEWSSCTGGGGRAQGCSSAPRAGEAGETSGSGGEGKNEGSGRGVAEVEGGRRNECGDEGRIGAERSGRGGEGGVKGGRGGEGGEKDGREESDGRESERENGKQKGEQQENGKLRKEEQGEWQQEKEQRQGQQEKEEQGEGKQGKEEQGEGKHEKEQQAREEKRRKKKENKIQQREKQKQQKREQQQQKEQRQQERTGPVYLMDFGGKIEVQDNHAPALTAAREYVEELEAGCEKLEGATWQKRVADVAAALDQSEAFYCRASKYVLFLCNERSLRDSSRDVTVGSVTEGEATPDGVTETSAACHSDTAEAPVTALTAAQLSSRWVEASAVVDHLLFSWEDILRAGCVLSPSLDFSHMEVLSGTFGDPMSGIRNAAEARAEIARRVVSNLRSGAHPNLFAEPNEFSDLVEFADEANWTDSNRFDEELPLEAVGHAECPASAAPLRRGKSLGSAKQSCHADNGDTLSPMSPRIDSETNVWEDFWRVGGVAGAGEDLTRVARAGGAREELARVARKVVASVPAAASPRSRRNSPPSASENAAEREEGESDLYGVDASAATDNAYGRRGDSEECFIGDEDSPHYVGAGDWKADGPGLSAEEEENVRGGGYGVGEEGSESGGMAEGEGDLYGYEEEGAEDANEDDEADNNEDMYGGDGSDGEGELSATEREEGDLGGREGSAAGEGVSGEEECEGEDLYGECGDSDAEEGEEQAWGDDWSGGAGDMRELDEGDAEERGEGGEGGEGVGGDGDVYGGWGEEMHLQQGAWEVEEGRLWEEVGEGSEEERGQGEREKEQEGGREAGSAGDGSAFVTSPPRTLEPPCAEDAPCLSTLYQQLCHVEERAAEEYPGSEDLYEATSAHASDTSALDEAAAGREGTAAAEGSHRVARHGGLAKPSLSHPSPSHPTLPHAAALPHATLPHAALQGFRQRVRLSLDVEVDADSSYLADDVSGDDFGFTSEDAISEAQGSEGGVPGGAAAVARYLAECAAEGADGGDSGGRGMQEGHDACGSPESHPAFDGDGAGFGCGFDNAGAGAGGGACDIYVHVQRAQGSECESGGELSAHTLSSSRGSSAGEASHAAGMGMAMHGGGVSGVTSSMRHVGLSPLGGAGRQQGEAVGVGFNDPAQGVGVGQYDGAALLSHASLSPHGHSPHKRISPHSNISPQSNATGAVQGGASHGKQVHGLSPTGAFARSATMGAATQAMPAAGRGGSQAVRGLQVELPGNSPTGAFARSVSTGAATQAVPAAARGGGHAMRGLQVELPGNGGRGGGRNTSSTKTAGGTGKKVSAHLTGASGAAAAGGAGGGGAAAGGSNRVTAGGGAEIGNKAALSKSPSRARLASSLSPPSRRMNDLLSASTLPRVPVKTPKGEKGGGSGTAEGGGGRGKVGGGEGGGGVGYTTGSSKGVCRQVKGM